VLLPSASLSSWHCGRGTVKEDVEKVVLAGSES
jgi:hypothetical protein